MTPANHFLQRYYDGHAQWLAQNTAPDHIRRVYGALQAILDEHQPEPYDDDPHLAFCGSCQRGGAAGHYPCPTVRHLAAVYRDEPEYQQDWSPGLP